MSAIRDCWVQYCSMVRRGNTPGRRVTRGLGLLLLMGCCGSCSMVIGPRFHPPTITSVGREVRFDTNEETKSFGLQIDTVKGYAGRVRIKGYTSVSASQVPTIAYTVATSKESALEGILVPGSSVREELSTVLVDAAGQRLEGALPDGITIASVELTYLGDHPGEPRPAPQTRPLAEAEIEGMDVEWSLTARGESYAGTAPVVGVANGRGRFEIQVEGRVHRWAGLQRVPVVILEVRIGGARVEHRIPTELFKRL